MSPAAPLVRVVRSGLEESVHLGHVAVCDADGRLVAALGDPDRVVFARSSMKPLQAAVSLRTIGDELASELVAVMCGSHSGEPQHVAAVRRLLRGGGVGVSALRCPSELPSRREDARQAAGPRRIFHSCSGKHAGMLRASGSVGWPLETYLAPSHRLQRAVLRSVRVATGVDRPRIGVDGCGLPVHGVPLRAMATLFARLGRPERLGALEQPVRTSVASMLAHPHLVAGTGRSDTAIMAAVPGVLAKVGAEALHCGAVLDQGLGIAVKVADGGTRAAAPALVRAFELLGALDQADRERLDRSVRRAVLGGGAPVGALLAEFELDRGGG